MKKPINTAAAILAGGRNSRMAGKNKAFIQIEGTSIIQKTFDILKEMFEEIVIVTNFPPDFRAYENESIITGDLIKDAGPLGGIHSALAVTSKEAVFFVACDMPNLHNALILRLVNYFEKSDFDVVVPRVNSFIEPLHGVYRKGLTGSLEDFLRTNKDYSIRNFLRTVNVGYLDLEDDPLNRRIFNNLNSPQDLKNLMEGLWK